MICYVDLTDATIEERGSVSDLITSAGFDYYQVTCGTRHIMTCFMVFRKGEIPKLGEPKRNDIIIGWQSVLKRGIVLAMNIAKGGFAIECIEKDETTDKDSDPVSNPTHYTEHPSGIECIQVTEHMGFNLGNAVKYIWRCDLKRDAIEDLKKAVWYLNREISKREGKE